MIIFLICRCCLSNVLGISGLPQNRGGWANLCLWIWICLQNALHQGSDCGIDNDPLFCPPFWKIIKKSLRKTLKRDRNLTLNLGPRVGKLSSWKLKCPNSHGLMCPPYLGKPLIGVFQTECFQMLLLENAAIVIIQHGLIDTMTEIMRYDSLLHCRVSCPECQEQVSLTFIIHTSYIHHTNLYKTWKFGVDWGKWKTDTFCQISKEMFERQTICPPPIHFFVNFGLSKYLYLIQIFTQTTPNLSIILKKRDISKKIRIIIWFE